MVPEVALLKSRWIQRFIWTADSLMSGIVLDRLIPSPLWAILFALSLIIIGNLVLNNPPRLFARYGVDGDAAETIRSVILSFLFLILSLTAAFLIV